MKEVLLCILLVYGLMLSPAAAIALWYDCCATPPPLTAADMVPAPGESP